MKQLTNQMRNQIRFTGKIRQALDQSAANLPNDYLHRLAMARKAALRVQKAEQYGVQWNLQAAGSASQGIDRPTDRPNKWTLGFVFSLVLLVATCLFEFYQIEQQNHLDEIAALDTDVLIDELPISAYADNGFNAFLKKNQQ